MDVATHIRQNISLPYELRRRLRELAQDRGSTLSGLIVHLVTTGLTVEEGGDDPLLRYVGSVSGPSDLSATVDDTVYGHGRPRR